MQQFIVPQFIDVEDKIIGPITTRQFVIVLVGALVTFILFKLLAFAYFVLSAIVVMPLAAMLAFARVNGRPVHFFLLNFLQTSKRSKLRVWNREAYVNVVQVVESQIKEKPKVQAVKAAVSGSRLRDISLVVNTGGIYQGEEIANDLSQ